VSAGAATAELPPPRAGSYVTGYQVPALGWRILGGGVWLILLIIFLIGLPVALLTFLQSHGISPPVPLLTVEAFGVALAVLVTLRYILKPTVAYGPLAVATAAVTLAYLYLILIVATYALAIPGTGVTISVGYSRLILILMIGPALALTAGLLTLVEDLNAPNERLPFDYPA
jgi:hypothetical protein